MMRNRIILVFLLFLIGVATPASAGADKTSDKEHLVQLLQGTVGDLLRGIKKNNLASSIDIEAYLVDGIYYESLPGVIKGESTQCHLVEGKGSKTVFESLIVNDAEDAAFMVVKTQSPGFGERFHSVVFFKSGRNDWKIKSWHISH